MGVISHDNAQWSYTYNDEGNIVHVLRENTAYVEQCTEDHCSSGVVLESAEQEEYTYDAFHNPLTHHTEEDIHGNDSWVTTEQVFWSNTYDTEGNKSIIIKEVDVLGDGSIDSRTEENWTWNTSVQILSYEYTHDENNDGDINVHKKHRWMYDSQGEISQESIYEDENGDDVPEISYTKTWDGIYDESGLLLSQEYLYDEGSDREIDTHTETMWTYDQDGQRDSVYVTDILGDTISYRSWRNTVQGEKAEEYFLEEGGILQEEYMYACLESILP